MNLDGKLPAANMEEPDYTRELDAMLDFYGHGRPQAISALNKDLRDTGVDFHQVQQALLKESPISTGKKADIFQAMKVWNHAYKTGLKISDKDARAIQLHTRIQCADILASLMK